MLRSVAGRLFHSYLGVVAIGLLVAAITISALVVRYENDVLRSRRCRPDCGTASSHER